MTLPFGLETVSGRYLDLLFVVTVIASPVAYRWLRALWLADVSARWRGIIETDARDAVAFAERWAATPDGKAKMATALAWLKDALRARGLALLPDDKILLGILQAVYAGLKASGVLAAAGPTLAQDSPPAAPKPAG